MGKATKWILNLLMGKREEKSKKTLENTCILGTPIVMSPSPMDTADVIIRRRWSFKRSTSKKPITYRKNRSFDSTIPMPLYHTHRNNAMPNAFNLHVAATKIQAVYRSYLARRALRALRGLVKLQALARGHLVRKQMNGVLRSMHAVMAIQVRARIHRIQVADKPPAAAIMFRRRKSDYREASDRQLRKQEQDNIADNWNNFPTSRVLRSRSSRLSVSQRERQPKMSPSSSTLTFTDEFSSSTTYDRQVDEFSFKMGQRGFRQHSVHCPDYMPSDSNFSPPNYMNNTKSSKAKARSHSEPRQRPKLGTKQKSRRTSSSMDAKNDKKNQYPWLIKLYRSDRSSTYDEECNTNNSDMSVIQFEPPMDLY